jgi:hypothetical protein
MRLTQASWAITSHLKLSSETQLGLLLASTLYFGHTSSAPARDAKIRMTAVITKRIRSAACSFSTRQITVVCYGKTYSYNTGPSVEPQRHAHSIRNRGHGNDFPAAREHDCRRDQSTGNDDGNISHLYVKPNGETQNVSAASRSYNSSKATIHRDSALAASATLHRSLAPRRCRTYRCRGSD